MYNFFKIGFKYLEYWITASNGKGHGVHSPFVYNFIESVLIDAKKYPDYKRVEFLRDDLLTDQTLLEIEDFGAGSYITPSKTRSVASIASSAAKSRKYGQLLYRLVKRYKPVEILELGTSLGISTCYLSLAHSEAMIHSLEGARSVADLAEENFRRLELPNIRLVRGNFDKTLPEILKLLPFVDFAFVDGNHRKEPTLVYFQQLLAKKKEGSIFIFDDIHWSQEMEEAWAEIKAHKSVMLTVDLFFVGIVFFSSSYKVKQHFRIRF